MMERERDGETNVACRGAYMPKDTIIITFNSVLNLALMLFSCVNLQLSPSSYRLQDSALVSGNTVTAAVKESHGLADR